MSIVEMIESACLKKEQMLTATFHRNKGSKWRESSKSHTDV